MTSPSAPTPRTPGGGTVFRLACGDVMPGCPAVFENPDEQVLMGAVAAHAAEIHSIEEITPEVARSVRAQVVRLSR